MPLFVESEIAKFGQWPAKLREAGFGVQSYCDFGFVVQPQGSKSAHEVYQGKTIALTLLGLTHGAEWAGVAVLNEVCALLFSQTVQLRLPLALALGNPWAAKENRRFLETDLNRSFGTAQTSSKEQRRAKELEKILSQTAFLVDFHQTMEKSENPFFIFPYSAKSLAFAATVSSNLPIVTHWGKPFSKDGRCSDEFTNSCGGTGITLELGRNGFDVYQIAAGVVASLKAIEAVSDLVLAKRGFKSEAENEIFTWANVIEYPEGEVVLEPGFYNFSSVSAGQKLGEVNRRPLLSNVDGKILFPAYPRPERLKPPAELCRIMKRIGFSDLPKG